MADDLALQGLPPLRVIDRLSKLAKAIEAKGDKRAEAKLAYDLSRLASKHLKSTPDAKPPVKIAKDPTDAMPLN